MSNNIYIEKIKQYQKIFSYNQDLPKNWQYFFQKEQPLVVDLGCGAGKFLLEKAKQEPNNNYIGIEIRYKRLVKAMQKYNRNSLHNIFLVQRKVKLLSEIFTPNSLHTVFVNFPDPWAKYKQLKHRLLCQNFFQDAYFVLKKGGNIFFKTDHREYFFAVKNLVENSDFFRIDNFLCLQNPQENAILTEFEALFLKKKKIIYSINFIKNEKDSL